MILFFRLFCISILSCFSLFANKQEEQFSLKIYPLLKEKCFGCHGNDPKKIKGDLDMRNMKGILTGGETGEPALVKGDAENSLIYQSIQWLDEDLEMPPKENDRLNETQVALIKNWINDGALWLNDSQRAIYIEKGKNKLVTADGVIVHTSGGLDDSWTYRRYQPEDLWAYQPLRKSKYYSSDATMIDKHVVSSLKEKGFKPTTKADKLTLIKRVTFDLIGLPPTPSEIENFLNDSSDHAWEKVIDRLLASPHYGEKAAQKWFDVARYSDTSGFSSDWEKSNAWRYRDYVIRSFNNDIPIKQFFIEQIAGDELKEPTKDSKIATGFLRMGPYATAMIPKEESRQQFLDDVTNSVGETFMATPLKCCKCHDHKFDPIPTKDYYSIQAVFAATHPGELKLDYSKTENINRFEEGKINIEKLLADAKAEVKRINTIEEKAARKWMKDKGLDYKPRSKLVNEPEDKKPPRFIGLSIQEQGYRKVREQDVRQYGRMLERYQPMIQSVYSGNYHVIDEKKLRPPKNIMSAAMQSAPKSYILNGGAVGSNGQEVKPGVLSSIKMKGNFKIENGLKGRRLSFAKWLANDKNSLVLRTYVNRIWQNHFGRGIAANPNNFGKTGTKPSHPDLLNDLSVFFKDHSWSTKQLHKLILMSETYQMKSTHENIKDILEADPNNELLGYLNVRRLSSEELRDGIISMTGELNPEMGGLPIFPEINLEVALQPRMLQFSLAPAYQPSVTPKERHRRSIYAYHFRGMPDPLMSVFNKPNADDSCERRDSSSVTPQVYSLMNSDYMYDRSIAFAVRLEKESKTLKNQINQAYHLCYGRKPTQQELSMCIKHVQSKIAYHKKHVPEKKIYPAQVKRSLIEEFSGKSFSYIEKLNHFKNIVSDVKSWDVSEKTRSLADLCMVLMNSNEFIYIY